MGDITYAENADMCYMNSHANGNSRDALRMYHVQFPDLQMPHHRIFLRLHRQHVRSTSPDMMLVYEEL
ncbi:hypothetical protein TNCV_3792221 [Trichonephila clavipes]|nr:hypothetical protein TNCV_3792221 [Trichonephila clavipes]